MICTWVCKLSNSIIFNSMATGAEETCAYLKNVESALGGKIPVDAIGIHPYTPWATKAPFDWGEQYGTLEEAFAVYRERCRAINSGLPKLAWRTIMKLVPKFYCTVQTLHNGNSITVYQFIPVSQGLR